MGPHEIARLITEDVRTDNGLVEDRDYERMLLANEDPYKLYDYARFNRHGRWPEAEPIIMKDPEWACNYARYVINGRWPEAEPFIMRDGRNAYYYAINIIKGRWPEAEPFIMSSLTENSLDNAHAPDWAYAYALFVIKGRWPEAEPVIMQNPLTAYYYAFRVIDGRWPEAEPFILQDPDAASQYAVNIIGRWPEFEEKYRKELEPVTPPEDVDLDTGELSDVDEWESEDENDPFVFYRTHLDLSEI